VTNSDEEDLGLGLFMNFDLPSYFPLYSKSGASIQSSSLVSSK